LPACRLALVRVAGRSRPLISVLAADAAGRKARPNAALAICIRSVDLRRFSATCGPCHADATVDDPLVFLAAHALSANHLLFPGAVCRLHDCPVPAQRARVALGDFPSGNKRSDVDGAGSGISQLPSLRNAVDEACESLA